MGFLKPKVPTPPPPPNPAQTPTDPTAAAQDSGISPAAASLITTSVQGLQRRASTQRTSLIGGGY